MAGTDATPDRPSLGLHERSPAAMANDRPAPLSHFSLSHFVRHYLEMVLAMAAGMMAYAMLFGRGMAFTGYRDEALMAAFMTVPMVAWMRYRGHTWRQAAEMAAAMVVPMAVVVILGAGRPGVSDRAIGVASHAAMLLGMLALMVVRRADYAHAGACHPAKEPTD